MENLIFKDLILQPTGPSINMSSKKFGTRKKKSHQLRGPAAEIVIEVKHDMYTTEKLTFWKPQNGGGFWFR